MNQSAFYKTGKKYLITSDGYFMAPDGNYYRAVWGEVSILSDEILGVKTNDRSSNWYISVGTEDRHVIIAGCQIHYAVACDKPPKTTDRKHVDFTKEGHNFEVKLPTVIFNPYEDLDEYFDED